MIDEERKIVFIYLELVCLQFFPKLNGMFWAELDTPSQYVPGATVR